MSDNLPTELERWRNKVTADMAGRAFALRCIDMGRVLALVEKCLPVVEAMAGQYNEYHEHTKLDGTPYEWWNCMWCDKWHVIGVPHTCPATQAAEIMREVNRDAT